MARRARGRMREARKYTVDDDSIVRLPISAASRRSALALARRASRRSSLPRRGAAERAACVGRAPRLLVGWLAHGAGAGVDIAGIGSGVRRRALRLRAGAVGHRSGWCSRSTRSRAAAAAARARAARSPACGVGRRAAGAGCFPATPLHAGGFALAAAALAARHRLVRPVRRRGAARAAARPRRAADAPRAAAGAAPARAAAAAPGAADLPLRRRRLRACCTRGARCSASLFAPRLALGPQDGVLGAGLGRLRRRCSPAGARFGWRGRTRHALALRRRRAAAAGLRRLALRARSGAEPAAVDR